MKIEMEYRVVMELDVLFGGQVALTLNDINRGVAASIARALEAVHPEELGVGTEVHARVVQVKEAE